MYNFKNRKIKEFTKGSFVNEFFSKGLIFVLFEMNCSFGNGNERKWGSDDHVLLLFCKILHLTCTIPSLVQLWSVCKLVRRKNYLGEND